MVEAGIGKCCTASQSWGGGGRGQASGPAREVRIDSRRGWPRARARRTIVQLGLGKRGAENVAQNVDAATKLFRKKAMLDVEVASAKVHAKLAKGAEVAAGLGQEGGGVQTRGFLC